MDNRNRNNMYFVVSALAVFILGMLIGMSNLVVLIGYAVMGFLLLGLIVFGICWVVEFVQQVIREAEAEKDKSIK